MKILVWLAISVIFSGVGWTADGPPPPGPKDRCAVCGMFVSKYPTWVATISYADGSHRYFDGPKDLFRFLAGDGAETAEDAGIWVTDYYTTKLIKARDAVFVRGSDILGPMGAELVPLASVEMAENFRIDHGGEAPLAFNDVDAGVLRSLE